MNECTKRDAEVLSACLNFSKIGRIVAIANQTEIAGVLPESRLDAAGFLSKKLLLGAMRESVTIDFLRRNHSSMECSSVNLEGRNVYLIDKSRGLDLIQNDPNGTMQKFSEECIGARAMVVASMPGYSDDGCLAIMSLCTFCGPLSAEGRFYRLHLGDGMWNVTKTSLVWVE